jgi:hypothetical protein
MTTWNWVPRTARDWWMSCRCCAMELILLRKMRRSCTISARCCWLSRSARCTWTWTCRCHHRHVLGRLTAYQLHKAGAVLYCRPLLRLA